MKSYGLIGLVIGLVIVGILVYRAGNIYTRGTTETQHAIAPPERAHILQCQTQIKKIENAIQLYYAENGRYPQSLDELDIPLQETYCPVTGQAYLYNPENGAVICPQHR
uniref:Type II secretion system protein GspG C-terminal domain-containing protein n=1 Tax=candidate division WOR-3 bacterium TaxID=2052148 RepID=A0A7C6AFD8_UNCW3